jgi:hypothetical protein
MSITYSFGSVDCSSANQATDDCSDINSSTCIAMHQTQQNDWEKKQSKQVDLVINQLHDIVHAANSGRL